MTVIPFPCERFTLPDVEAIAQRCYELIGEGISGGWARLTNSQGEEVIYILDVRDQRAQYRFGRRADGSYRVDDAEGRLLASGRSIHEVLAVTKRSASPLAASGGGTRPAPVSL